MKASKRRARARKQSRRQPKIEMAAFTDVEEAFFREGAALASATSTPLDFSELEEPRRPSLWRRLFA